MRRDSTSATYFNQLNITLEATADVDLDVLGLSEDVAMVARLTGAPDGSRIAVDRVPSTDALRLRVSNPAIFRYESEYILYNENGNLELRMEIESIYVREDLQDSGIGTRSVMLSLREAKALGFASVALYAAGSARDRSMFRGYHVWPSMGFDATLPTEKKRRLPEGLAHAERLSDLMLSEEGVEWWYTKGSAIDVEFDLDDNSISWQLCENYADARGIYL